MPSLNHMNPWRASNLSAAALEVGRDVLGAPLDVRGGSGGPALPDSCAL